MFVGILIGVAVFLFLGALISKRRFGLLGLALTAGATLSVIWDEYANMLVAMIGVFPSGPMTEAVTLSALVLLPALLLLFHGYSYKAMAPRLIGSLLFAALGVTFLVIPIGHAVTLSGIDAEVYRILVANKDLIVSIGVSLAVADFLFTKPVRVPEKK